MRERKKEKEKRKKKRRRNGKRKEGRFAGSLTSSSFFHARITPSFSEEEHYPFRSRSFDREVSVECCSKNFLSSPWPLLQDEPSILK